MTRALRTVLAVAAAGCIGGAASMVRIEAQATRDLEVLQLRPNFFMIAGAGGNIGVQVGEDGVVVVDAGAAARADAVVAAIKKVTAQPIRYIIDTSADPDHVGGNETLSKAGQTLFTARGGTINGEIAALNRLVDLAIPSVPIVSRDAGTLVIPGHGRVCDQYDVAAYRDMVSVIRDRVRDLKKAGMTLNQVKAAAPARG